MSRSSAFSRRGFGRAALWLAPLAMAAAVLPSAPVQAADPIKIGFSMSSTGGLAGGGKSALLAYEIWRDDVNAKGGLLGRPVQLINYDDQSNPALVPAIYSKLLDIDKVDFVISAYATNQIAPAMPIVMQRKLLFMALFGTGVNDEFKYDKYFQILPNGVETKQGPSRGFLDVAMTMNPKPQTIALVAADAEYAQNVIEGARENVKKLGLKVVYDRSYPPTTTDYTPIARAIQASNPDVVFVASYPPDSVGIVRAANEIGLKPKMFGGGMIGLAFTPIKAQLGPLLNGIVAYDVYVPEPTMKFPGIDAFLKVYQEKAAAQGVDPLGYYLGPWAYARMQIIADAVEATKGFDQDKLADYIHKNSFKTVVGDVAFGEKGEWTKARVMTVQLQNIAGTDVDNFRDGKGETVLWPDQYKNGDPILPYSDIKH